MRSSRALRVLRCGPFPGCKSEWLSRRLSRSSSEPLVASKSVTNPTVEANATTTPAPQADHRHLGVQQGLFTTSVYSPGSTLFLPRGAHIFNKLVSFLRAQYSHFGFDEVITPTIYKRSLWEKSGHWENYSDDMFSVDMKQSPQNFTDEKYGLKPMNCPGHCLLFASEPRSFRELPIRYADFSPLHRNETSGALSGLTRLRKFHQDDGHIFCRPCQVSEEISRTLDFINLTYMTLNLGPYRLSLSTRPRDHFIGTVEEWENAELALRQALDASGQTWNVNEGDGAFYGPKIDIILTDSDGKEHQTATIQLDFQLPKRFDLQYQSPAAELEQKGLTTTDPGMLAKQGPVRPVMIHRAILGSIERLMALLIEHYNGHWPFWLNPRQVAVITVSSDGPVVDYAHSALNEIQGGLGTAGASRARAIDRTAFAIDMDGTPRTLKKKISDAKRKRYSIIVVVGRDNMKRGKSVTVDFSGISDPRGIIRRELRACMPLKTVTIVEQEEPTSDDLKAVETTPQTLREIMLCLEREYV